MKTINNTCVEVLPALLNKTKTSTIRKAWKEINYRPLQVEQHSKPAKYKVGDIVPMVWNRDSKYNDFCICHGIGYGGTRNRLKHVSGLKYFNKNLGDVEITEVFKITMEKNAIWLIDGDGVFSLTFLNKIVKSEGFESAEKMFEYFDNCYSLDTPKQFWLYNFRWLD